MSRTKVVFSIGAMHGGGSERQMVSLLRNLDRDRFEPFLYLVYRSGPLLDEVPDDVKIISFEERFGPQRGPGFLMHRKRVADMSRFFKEIRADVSYDRTFLMTLITAEAAQRVGVPNVSNIVTDPRVGFPQVAGRWQWFKRRILRRLYQRSALALANSEGAARAAESFYGLEHGLVHVLHNGVDLEDVQSKAAEVVNDEWWNEASAKDKLVRIVTAGRLDDKKGFHLLIAAIDDLRNAHPNVELRLSILGEGPERESLQRQITAANLSKNVRLAGFQKNAPAWYRAADLFVLPSLLEGMPNVLLEAIACETPVLSSDCESGPREILDGGRCGALCEPGSVRALTQGIQKFLADEELGSRYNSQAVPRLQELFSIQSAVRKLETHLLNAVGDDSRL